jgi:SAM-dependent methyltransferase
MYICNITGNLFTLDESEKHREGGMVFGYNIRFRALCYVLSQMLFGELIILTEMDENKGIKGIGMSDSTWANIFESKFDYLNTYYHKQPYLDIYNDDHILKYNNLDFIISSEVFEHIDPYPDIQKAFNNLYNMLKSGGFIVFSVPYNKNKKHIEHFPSLYDYKIVKINEKYILYNRTNKGKVEYFDNLCFHGGPGNVLEMRVFSKRSITNYLEKAGFVDIIFYNITDDMKKYGIFWENENSLIISAKKK